MTITSSGLWCDLCRKPILDGPWWHCSIEGKMGSHSCDNCKKEREKVKIGPEIKDAE